MVKLELTDSAWLVSIFFFHFYFEVQQVFFLLCHEHTSDHSVFIPTCMQKHIRLFGCVCVCVYVRVCVYVCVLYDLHLVAWLY